MSKMAAFRTLPDHQSRFASWANAFTVETVFGNLCWRDQPVPLFAEWDPETITA